MNRVLMVIMAAGVLIGGIDRILGNRRGYGFSSLAAPPYPWRG